MRWGISNEVSNTHMATTICLNEIKTCVKYSLGPNFIALLSHRYGARVLPTRIISKEFEIFKNEITDNTELNDNENVSITFLDKNGEMFRITNLLEHCYQLDKNEIPPRYKLKHIDEILSDFDENVINVY